MVVCLCVEGNGGRSCVLFRFLSVGYLCFGDLGTCSVLLCMVVVHGCCAWLLCMDSCIDC